MAKGLMERLRGVPGMAALALLLAGCVADPAALAGGGSGAVRSAAVLDGAFTVAAPRGYCIAPGAGRQGEDSAVVLIGRCPGETSVPPAVLTVSVGAAGSAGVLSGGGAALTAYFQSNPGRATLSRSGKAADVHIVEAVGRGNTFYLRVSDRLAGDYWRAILGLGGRLVTVSASGAEGLPLTPDEGRKLVESAVARLVAANGHAGG